MSAAFLIVFREMLEMVLILGMLSVVCRDWTSRGWMTAGSLMGLCGAWIVALFMEQLEGAMDGDGEFLFNAVLLLLASMMLVLTLIWMRHQGLVWRQRTHALSDQLKGGRIPGLLLAFLGFSAVIREGAETVFFMFSLWHEQQMQALWLGAMLGAVAAILLGVAVYHQLIKVRLNTLFAVMSWLLAFVAAGLASQAVSYLVLMDWLPPLIEHVWDMSSWLPSESMPGTVLRVLIGYDDAPSGTQLLVFVLYLAITLAMVRWTQSQVAKPASSSS
ncbi:MAG: iron permease [Zetaproteobacteria bacterium]|nr:MAG: iron permease [Zetaproteobacteria bacterium]